MARSRIALKLALIFGGLCALVAATSTLGQPQTAIDSELLQTPAQWEQSYQCALANNPNDTSSGSSSSNEARGLSSELASRLPWWQRIWFKIMHACNRDSSSWRFLYIDEMLGRRGFTPRILERSPSERLANIVYAISLNGLADLSYFKFNSGDARQDRENEQLVAGPRVSQEQCDQDLSDMSSQFEELQQLIARLRAGDSSARFEPHHLRLVRTLDTYGRYEAATMTGQMKLLGGYSQCEISQLERRPTNKFQVQEEHQQRNNKQLAMRYCWAKLNLGAHVSEELRRRPRLDYETSETSLQVGICLPRSCHTRTLHQHKSTVQRFVDSQLQLPSTIYVNQSLHLESVFCLVDPESEFRLPLSGKLFFVFVGLWLAACCAATHFRLGESRRQADEQAHKSSLEPASKLSAGLTAALSAAVTSTRPHKPKGAIRLLSHLNLRNSWNDFTADKRQISASERVDLDVLNPVKLFACGFCIAAHAALLLATVSGHQGEIAAQVERDYIIQAALLTSVVVDTFFVISGFLLTYIILKKLAAGFGFGNRQRREELPAPALSPNSNSTTFTSSSAASSSSSTTTSSSSSWIASPKDLSNFFANWFVLTANRYFRLVPLYAIMFWFRRDVLTYLGSGPMWDYGFNRDTMNGACMREPSFTPFTPITAFVPLNKQCYVPSWSVANDILFAFVLPPIILLLRQRPKLGLSVTMALLAAGVANSVRGYVEAEPQNRWELGEFRLHGVILFFNGLSDLYSSPFYRTSSYLIGTIAGYSLFKYEQNSPHKEAGQWPGWLRRFVTPVSVVYLVLHTVSSLQAMQIKALFYPYQRLIAAFLSTIDRPLWASANAVLFVRMVTDWRLSPLMQSWAGQTWRTLARLNFAILFTHWIFIVIQTNVLTALPTFTGWQIYAQVASIYLAGLPAAVFVHVVFENPIDKLVKRELFAM